jgi:hypothetical protein
MGGMELEIGFELKSYCADGKKFTPNTYTKITLSKSLFGCISFDGKG